MTDIFFKSANKAPGDKISIIVDDDFLSYGIFDQNNLLKETQRFRDHDLNSFLNEFENLDSLNPRLCIKTKGFLFDTDVKNFSDIENSVLNKFSGQEVFCMYPNTFESKWKKRHFSVLMHHHYFTSQASLCHIHLEDSYLHIYVINNGKFLLYNIFSFSTEEDLIYILHFAKTSLNLSEGEFPVILSGLIDENSKLFKSISSYNDNVSFFSAEQYSVDASILLKKHYYFDHFLNINCP